MLIGGADEDGTVSAAWGDTWHQKPGLLVLAGRSTDGGVQLSASYMVAWGWEIELDGLDATPSMIMRNVVPESALSMAPPGVEAQAGPYDVMVLRVTQ